MTMARALSLLDRVNHTTTWCRRCQAGDHSGHRDTGGLCVHDNQYNADCRCDRRPAEIDVARARLQAEIDGAS